MNVEETTVEKDMKLRAM